MEAMNRFDVALDRTTRRIWPYAIPVLCLRAAPIADIRPGPEMTFSVVAETLQGPLIFGWPPLFPLLKAFVALLFCLAAAFRAKANRIADAGFALLLLGIAIFQNAALTPSYGRVFLVGNFLVQLPIALLLARKAIKPRGDPAGSGRGTGIGGWNIVILALASAAFLLPIEDGSSLSAAPAVLLGSESMATFCMALPVALAFYGAFGGREARLILRIGGFAGFLFGIMNMAGFADQDTALLAVFHIPLLAVSIISFIRSFGRKAEPRGLAIVTGATRGIGLAIARELAARKYDLFLVGRDEASLARNAADIGEAYGVGAIAHRADLSSAQETEGAYAAAAGTGKDIDVLVNCAGFNRVGNFLETSLERELEMISVHACAATILSKLCAKDMAGRGRGRILNVASDCAFLPLGSDAVYAATKAFMLSFSLAMASDLAPYGVDVSALCPGVTETDLFARGNIGNIRLRRLPAASPERVARSGCRGLFSGRRVVVPGLFNKAMAASLRFLPASIVSFLGRVFMEPARGSPGKAER